MTVWPTASQTTARCSTRPLPLGRLLHQDIEGACAEHARDQRHTASSVLHSLPRPDAKGHVQRTCVVLTFAVPDEVHALGTGVGGRRRGAGGQAERWLGAHCTLVCGCRSRSTIIAMVCSAGTHE